MKHALQWILVFVIAVNIGISEMSAAEFHQVRRERTTLREGPGSFYPAIAELSRGVNVEVIRRLEGWYRVRVQELDGYISAKATQEQASQSAVEDAFSQMGHQPAVTKVARSGVSAAVKGFAERFARRLEGDTTLLREMMDYRLDPTEYQAFREEVYAGRDINRIRGRIDLPSVREHGVFSFSAEGVGYGIASQLATMGLVRNRSVRDYVNLVGNLVVEASGAYDISFKFFVLDLSAVNAYSTPGGLVFITRGALARMQTEAELACFLGHEIAHVILRHGMQEMEKRKVMITADNAFMELESETSMSDELRQTSDELESIALESYETIYAGRLQEYEDEADEYGLLCAARAGYNPKAMVDFLGRITQENVLSGNNHYTPEQNTERLNRIQSWLSAWNLPWQQLVANFDSFRRHVDWAPETNSE